MRGEVDCLRTLARLKEVRILPQTAGNTQFHSPPLFKKYNGNQMNEPSMTGVGGVGRKPPKGPQRTVNFQKATFPSPQHVPPFLGSP